MRRPVSARMLQSAWNSFLRQLVATFSHDLDPSTDGRSKATLPLSFNRHVLCEAQQFDWPHKAMGKHCHVELAVLFPSCDGLGYEQVGQVGAHTLRVVAKGLVELRAFAE